jgi:uncharacterized protein YcnI
MASAHVTVWPKNLQVGAWEKYTMRVPVEKNVPTVKITLKVPAGVQVENYEPVAGWNYSVTKDSSGHVATVTWTATGSGLLPGQFLEFPFVAQNPKQAGNVAWNAFQYYKDGSIVEWTGDEGTKTPHSITNIVSKDGASTPVQKEASNATTDSPATGNQSSNSGFGLANVLSVISIVLSVVAIVFSLRKKS